MSICFDLYADHRARTNRLVRRRKFPWQAQNGFEPSYEALRDQYSAEFDARFNDHAFSEWSPVSAASASQRLKKMNSYTITMIPIGT